MTVETINHSSVERPSYEQLPGGVEMIDVPEAMQSRVDALNLPSGYALIGGAARSIATEMLIGRTLPVRDIDVAAFTEYDPDLSQSHEVSMLLMPEDYAFGHGVKPTSLSDYFSSRDFTMNEVAIVNGQLLISEAAKHDLAHSIIRPTEYEHNPEQDWHLSPKLAVKSVLLQAMLEHSTGMPASVEGVDLSDYYCDLVDGEDEDLLRPFFVSLGFQKALEYGEDVAGDFLDKLLQYNMVRAKSLDYTVAADQRLYVFAHELTQASDFEFRGVASEYVQKMRELAQGNYSLGDLLHSIAGDEYERYVHYHEVALDYSGKGKQYTDESKY